MPYIVTERRTDDLVPQNVGELNYAITREINKFLKENGTSYAHLNNIIGILFCLQSEKPYDIITEYVHLNKKIVDLLIPFLKAEDKITTAEVLGVLECVKLELYRRVAAPYEDKKCQENGDVYG